MEDHPRFCAKHVLRYLMYVFAIGICLAGLVYLLFQAHPMVSPKVKDSTSSRLVRPALRIDQTRPLRAV